MLNFLFLAAQRYSITTGPIIVIIRQPFVIVFRIFVGECTQGGSAREPSKLGPNFAITQFVAANRYKPFVFVPVSPYQCIRLVRFVEIEAIGIDLDVVAQKFGRK